MGYLILIVVIGLPLAEIGVFIQVGDAIGVLTTLALTVATAVFGVACVRWQGLSVLGRLRAAQMTGEAPVVPMLEGALIALAGVFLLIPGFLTDAAGLILLLPPARTAMATVLARRAAQRGTDGFAGRAHHQRGGTRSRRGLGFPPIIEGEVRDVDPASAAAATDTDPPQGSRWGR